jgi:hypothetical protein
MGFSATVVSQNGEPEVPCGPSNTTFVLLFFVVGKKNFSPPAAGLVISSLASQKRGFQPKTPREVHKECPPRTGERLQFGAYLFFSLMMFEYFSTTTACCLP